MSMHQDRRNTGYDELERWAHEEDRKRIEALRKKREAEEGKDNPAEGSDA